METMKVNTVRTLGIVIIISALAIGALKYYTEGDIDSYMMPFILFCMGVVFVTKKSAEKPKQIRLKPHQARIALWVGTIVLIMGIIAFALCI